MQNKVFSEGKNKFCLNSNNGPLKPNTYMHSEYLNLAHHKPKWEKRLKNRSKVKGIVFNITFNNISDLSWQSVLLVESLTNFIT